MPHRRISDALGLGQRDSLRHYQLVTQDRPLWPIDWRYIVYVVLHLFWYGDSRQIRAVFATASLGWAVLILNADLLAGPNYAMLRHLPAWFWSLLFLVHAVGGWWRLIERRPRPRTAFVLNLVGVVVWFLVTSAINWSAGHIVIGSVLEWCVLSIMVCATINTGRNEEAGTV